jgi:hypothetical protein
MEVIIMKKYIFTAIAVIAVMFVTISLNAQMGGPGDMEGPGGPGGAMEEGPGGDMGFGMMGGRMGGRVARGPVVRPDKKARLASIAELEKQVAALKAAIENAPDKDTEITPESDRATIQKAAEERQAENKAITAIQSTLSSLRNEANVGGGRRRGIFATNDVLSELRVLANGEKATKTVAHLDTLIKEAQTRTRRNRDQGRGAGMMRGDGNRNRGARGDGAAF